MTTIIIAQYDSGTTLANVHDDLVSSGIPQEKIRVAKERHEVSVMSPGATAREINEILARHKPVMGPATKEGSA